MKPFKLSLAAIVAAFSTTTHAQTYVVSDLGPGIANDINNSGQVVGVSGNFGFFFNGTSIALQTNVFLTDPTGPAGTLVAVRAGSSSLVAINDLGDSVGQILLPPNSEGPFKLSGTNHTYFAPGAQVTGINSSGATVFWQSGFPSYDTVGTVFGSFSGPTFSKFFAINSGGTIAGTYGEPSSVSGDRRAYRCRATTTSSSGTITVLDTRTLTDTYLNFSDLVLDENHWSDAYAINDSGSVAGAMLLAPGGARHAFRHVGSGMEDLGTLGGINSVARDINASGAIVGEAQLADGTWHGFLYSGGTMIDLNTMLPSGSGWEVVSAKAINNSGAIAGQGRIGGVLHAIVLVPSGAIPSPRIDSQPLGGRIGFGQSLTLSVTAGGVSPFTYQWTRNNTNIVNATNSTYVISSGSASDVGDYRVLVSNAGGTTPSLTVHVDVLDPELTAVSYVGLDIVGAIGATYRVEFRLSASPSDWTTLTNLTLATSPQAWIDLESRNQPSRIYRAVRLP